MTSSNVINGQVHNGQVITNIQYQIVGVYWMNNSTPFIDWYFDVKKTSWFGGNIAPGFLIEFSTRSFFL
jgi:hypothetical protein